MENQKNIASAKMAFDCVKDDFRGLDHEEVWVIFLTVRNGFIAKEMLSRGTLTYTALDNRTVIRKALLYNAAAIILFHNHPSNETTPSKEDIKYTKGLREACDLMDVKLVDHIITGEDSFYSFSNEKTYQSKA